MSERGLAWWYRLLFLRTKLHTLESMFAHATAFHTVGRCCKGQAFIDTPVRLSSPACLHCTVTRRRYRLLGNVD